MADYAGQQLGNYRLIRLLGQGGFANVYLAEHVYLKTSVAIKVLQVLLTDDALDKFLSEARTIARLSHPHIIRVQEFGIEQSTPFLVMNYAPYGSLRQRHPAGSVLSSVQILSYVRQSASALQYAHDRMIIHRDVKPENMLLGEAFTLMLSDFGLATTVQNQGQSVSGMPVHHTQSAAGTTTYMAPEQFDGIPSPASDQYALAVTVYEWLCGTPPFQGNAMGVAVQHMQTAPPPLREKLPAIAASVEQVVLRALAKDPRNRFPSVQDFAQALAESCQPVSATSNYQQGVAPIILPSMSPAPHGSQFSAGASGSRLHDYASATVADHDFASVTRPEQLKQYSQSKRHRGPFGELSDSSSLLPISRRRVMFGLAGATGALAAFGAAAAWFALSRGGAGTVRAHPTPSISPTPDAEATARALMNAVESRPSILALGPGRLALFVRGGDNALWNRRYDGSWHNWESLGGTLQFDPVGISWDGQRIDLFMRGSDNTLQHRVYDGSWHAWESLGGSLTSDPAVASWQPGRLDVFARSTDTALWHIWYDGSWHNWESLGGSISTGPTTTSWRANQLDVFARGADNALWHRAWNFLFWSGWQSLGGNLTSAPTATSWNPQRLDVFARGSDATLQHIWYDGGSSQWQPWESLGGQIAGAPTAVSWGNNRIDIVARDPGNALQYRWFDGNWEPWSLLR